MVTKTLFSRLTTKNKDQPRGHWLCIAVNPISGDLYITDTVHLYFHNPKQNDIVKILEVPIIDYEDHDDLESELNMK